MSNSADKKKLRPMNVARKQGYIDQDARLLQFSPVSAFLFFLLGLPMLGYLTMKYYGRDPYGDFAALLLLLGIVGLLGGVAISYYIHHRTGITLQNYYLKDFDKMQLFVLYTVLLFAMLGYIWAILGTMFEKYSLNSTELYFYYIGAAIMEEMFFRYFLCGASKTYLNDLRRHKRIIINEHVENGFLAIFSAMLFMVSHWEVYGKSIIGMSAVFFGGIAFALFYLYTKDISITMIAHALVNIVAVGNLLMTTGGI